MKIWLGLGILCLGLSLNSFAEGDGGSSASSVPTLTPAPEFNKDFQKLDQILGNKAYDETYTLTDPALRASDGSLSRYSVKSALTYSGPGINNLSGAVIPSTDGVLRNNNVKASGNVYANYRQDSTTTLSFGSGVTFNDPFTGTNQSDIASNPFVQWNKAYRWKGLEFITSPEILASTDPTYTNVGEVGGLNWYNSGVYNFDKTNWKISLSTSMYYWAFGRGYLASDNKAGSIVQQYSFSWTPGAKYKFNDRWVAYSNLGFQVYNPRNTPNASILWNAQTTWQTGFGWAYDRDIYVSPYVQAFPSNLIQDNVTANLSLTFSLL